MSNSPNQPGLTLHEDHNSFPKTSVEYEYIQDVTGDNVSFKRYTQKGKIEEDVRLYKIQNQRQFMKKKIM